MTVVHENHPNSSRLQARASSPRDAKILFFRSRLNPLAELQVPVEQPHLPAAPIRRDLAPRLPVQLLRSIVPPRPPRANGVHVWQRRLDPGDALLLKPTQPQLFTLRGSCVLQNVFSPGALSHPVRWTLAPRHTCGIVAHTGRSVAS